MGLTVDDATRLEIHALEQRIGADTRLFNALLELLCTASDALGNGAVLVAQERIHAACDDVRAHLRSSF